MKTYLFFSFVILQIFASKASSANPEWITYTFGDEIFTMIDDGDYLWLGTDGGLVKFNKQTEEKIYYNKASTANGLMDNHIRALAMDSKKNLWVGTEYGGVSKFDGTTWQNFMPDNSELPYEYISCIAVDKNDKIFIGNGDYLTILDGKIWTSYELGSPILAFFAFNNIVFDSDNHAWISTRQSGPSRMFVYRNNEITSIENDTTYFLNSLVIDKGNNIWCGSSKMGLLKFNGNYFEVYDTTNSNIPSNDIFIIRIDETNNLWCTIRGSIWKYDKENWTEYKPDIPLTRNEVFPRSMVIDGYGILWIGTWGQGLLKYDGEKWERYETSNSGLINNFLNLIATDEDGKAWITFWQPRDSVLCFDGKSWSFHRKEDVDFWNSHFQSICTSDSVQIWTGKGILVEFIQAAYNWAGVYNISNYRHGNHIKLDKDGNVWQISSHKGMWKYDRHSWTLFNYLNTPIDFHDVGSIAFDDHGNLYANSDRGIIKYDGTNWVLYPRGFFLSDTLNNGIFAMEVDRVGNIWLGTLGEGLIKFDGNNITKYDYTNSPIHHYAGINDLHFDNSGNLWVVTSGSGLIKFDCKDKWIIYNSENSGIFSRFDIAPLEIDIHDNIWFGMWWGGLGVFHEGGVITTGIKEVKETCHPISFTLLQNYPNPFNPSTSIQYQIPTASFVSLRVFDLLGREIAALVNEEKPPGTYTINFDGSSLSSGVYFYSIGANNFHQTKKLILMR